MDVKAVHERIVEFSRIRPDAKRDEIALLEVALFVEDVFGLILSDQEICEENLGTHQTTEKFVLEKLNLA
jgi:acyl carrier protein